LDRYAQSLLAERTFSFSGIEDGPTLVVLDGEVGAMLDKEPWVASRPNYGLYMRH